MDAVEIIVVYSTDSTDSTEYRSWPDIHTSYRLQS